MTQTDSQGESNTGHTVAVGDNNVWAFLTLRLLYSIELSFILFCHVPCGVVHANVLTMLWLSEIEPKHKTPLR